MDKHLFVETALDEALKTFVVALATLEAPVLIMILYSIRELLLIALTWDKFLIGVLKMYNDFVDNFILT